MRHGPGISVIIPCCDAWPTLHRTLAAVVADCRCLNAPWEVIVVDNEGGTLALRSLVLFAAQEEGVQVIRRTGLQGMNFQPGAARNEGIEAAKFDCLMFLDADCVPASRTIRTYHDLAAHDRATVFLGHRVFIASPRPAPSAIAGNRSLLVGMPHVASASNYGHPTDRRMDELRALADHPRPYDCLFGCNFALHRSCLADNRFNPVFDGYWGYEDIELGYRLHRAGRRFRYVPGAFVYHQEGNAETFDRARGRRRNFAIASTLIPGFEVYRGGSSRLCAVPPSPHVHAETQRMTA